MVERDSQVGATADGLVVIRSGEAARRLLIEDPFAPWFVTEQGQKLSAAAMGIDRVYEAFNLSRFRYTTDVLRARCGQYRQLILLGAGFDCRALWLYELRGGRIDVFEVDRREKLEQKARVLSAHGAPIFDWVHWVAADLQNDDVPFELVSAGYDPSEPCLVLAEGLTFFLHPDATRKLVDPAWMHLTPGSRLVFDCWTEPRVTALNRRAQRQLGVALFHPCPWATASSEPRASLAALGYREIAITSLDELASAYYGGQVEDEFPASWRIVELRL